MRVTYAAAPLAAVGVLSVYAGVRAWGLVLGGVVWPVVLAAVFGAAWMAVSLSRISSGPKRAAAGGADEGFVLESLALSPFVEKVRWSLEAMGVPFREEKDIGILFMLAGGRSVPVLRWRSSFTEASVPNSACALRLLFGKAVARGDEAGAEMLRPTPERVQLEQRFDVLGHTLQRFLYYHLLESEGGRWRPVAASSWGCDDPEVPWWQRKVLQPILFPIQVFALRKLLRLGAPGARERMVEAIEAEFAYVDGLLADGRSFLDGGDAPSFADFTWAAMAGLATRLDAYGGPAADASRAATDDALPPRLVEDMKRFRKHRSHGFALSLYTEHRHTRASASASAADTKKEE